jgi:hypothetical protein
MNTWRPNICVALITFIILTHVIILKLAVPKSMLTVYQLHPIFSTRVFRYDCHLDSQVFF